MDPTQEKLPPEMERVWLEGLRKMSYAEKAQQVGAMWEMAQQLVQSDVRRRHPNADEHEFKMRVASRFLPPELMLKAFGWDVEKEGY